MRSRETVRLESVRIRQKFEKKLVIVTVIRVVHVVCTKYENKDRVRGQMTS